MVPKIFLSFANVFCSLFFPDEYESEPPGMLLAAARGLRSTAVARILSGCTPGDYHFIDLQLSF